MTRTTRAGLLRETGPDSWWQIEELVLDDPGPGEVLIRVMAAGLCHSDDHVRVGDTRFRLPMVGGHEGAGIVEAIGPGVTRVKVGDHVSCSYVPVCGTCRYCATGRQNLCDSGKNAQIGAMMDGTYRFHGTDGEDIGGMCVLGTFSPWAVISEWACVKVDDDLPFELVALVSCGVTTGWGSAVYAAGVRAGDTAVVFGVGGVGINAVQGAAYAGAKNIVAVDPNPFKLTKALEFGATHAFADPAEAHAAVAELTRGQLADHAIMTVGVMDEQTATNGFDIIGKGATMTLTGVGPYELRIPGSPIVGWAKKVQGALFGGANPTYDIPRLLGLWRNGDLKLDEVITRRYTLDELNQGYRDMLAGVNLRGVLIHDH